MWFLYGRTSNDGRKKTRNKENEKTWKENQNAYNNVITEFATNYKLVNLDKVDITNYLVDSAHPNKDGMEKIAEQIVKDMLK